ncbi:uncharacterized protein LOC127748444 [Arachis duranensis]|uniref:Uncharacterized protein LOC127748444 n=1 Tax=Arachis duranensis TaxID=130453 RepID=A0A9C6TZZ5_ARADU|nr:uncharacterized protein LOC127748444 [Arachis duranensis]
MEKGSLGALDGTYIEVIVLESEKARYRTRKGKICTNVLGVCNREMGFVYVLSGWKGLASNSQSMEMDPEEKSSIFDEFMPDGDEEQDGMIDVVNMENKHIWSDEETNALLAS